MDNTSAVARASLNRLAFHAARYGSRDGDESALIDALDQLDALAAYVREMASVFIADRRAVVEECKKVMFDYFSKNALYTDAIDALDRILEKKP